MIRAFFRMWKESFVRRWRLHVIMWRGGMVDPAPGMLWELYVLAISIAALLLTLMA